MGFPENILTKDEKVVRSLHPHWMTIVKPLLVALLIVAVAAVIVWLTPVDPTWDIVDWVIIAIGILVLLWFVAVPFLKWRTTHYVITNKRVVVRRGILAKSGQDIALSKITDVSFRQSLLDRITKAGSLNIETAGDSPDEDFSSIPRSNEIQQLLNHLIEEDAASKGGYGEAAHRGHQMMGQRSYDDAPGAPSDHGQGQPRSDRQAGPPPAAQEPPRFEPQQFEQPSGSNGGGWDTGNAPRRDTRQYQAPQDGGHQDGGQNGGYQAPQDGGQGGQGGGYQGGGGQWETPPTRSDFGLRRGE